MTYQTNAIAHGIGNSAVSSQWYSRPDDQKFLSLDDMLAYKRRDAQQMTSRIVNTHKMQIVGQFDEQNPSRGDIGLALRQLGWRPIRDWTVSGEGRRAWVKDWPQH